MDMKIAIEVKGVTLAGKLSSEALSEIVADNIHLMICELGNYESFTKHVEFVGGEEIVESEQSGLKMIGKIESV